VARYLWRGVFLGLVLGQRCAEVGVGGLGARVEQVRADRVVEHVGVLRHDADDAVERIDGHVANVVVVDQDCPGIDVIEAHDEIADGRLASGHAGRRARALGDAARVWPTVLALPVRTSEASSMWYGS